MALKRAFRSDSDSMVNDDSYSEKETEKRRDAALLRALSTPHKKQADMKVGKVKGPGGKRRAPKNHADDK